MAMTSTLQWEEVGPEELANLIGVKNAQERSAPDNKNTSQADQSPKIVWEEVPPEEVLKYIGGAEAFKETPEEAPTEQDIQPEQQVGLLSQGSKEYSLPHRLAASFTAGVDESIIQFNKYFTIPLIEIGALPLTILDYTVLGKPLHQYYEKAFIKPLEQRKKRFEKEAETKSWIGKQANVLAKSFGRMAIDIPETVALGFTTRVGAAAANLSKYISNISDFVLGAGTKGAIEGYQQGGIPGAATGAVEQATMARLYTGKPLEEMGSKELIKHFSMGLKESLSRDIGRFTAVGLGQTFYDAAKQGRTPTLDEIENSFTQSLGMAVGYKVIPIIEHSVAKGRDSVALKSLDSKLKKAYQSGDVEAGHKILNDFFQNPKVSDKTKQALWDAMRTGLKEETPIETKAQTVEQPLETKTPERPKGLLERQYPEGFGIIEGAGEIPVSIGDIGKAKTVDEAIDIFHKVTQGEYTPGLLEQTYSRAKERVRIGKEPTRAPEPTNIYEAWDRAKRLAEQQRKAEQEAELERIYQKQLKRVSIDRTLSQQNKVIPGPAGEGFGIIEGAGLPPSLIKTKLRKKPLTYPRGAKYVTGKPAPENLSVKYKPILTTKGVPWKTEKGATLALRKQKRLKDKGITPETHEVVPVDGGFAIIRKKEVSNAEQKRQAGKIYEGVPKSEIPQKGKEEMPAEKGGKGVRPSGQIGGKIKETQGQKEEGEVAGKKKPVEKADVKKPGISGKTGNIITDSGKRIPFKWRIVEKDDVIASHDPETLKKNPEYLSDLQPRSRDRMSYAAQIKKMANRLIPEWLSDSFKPSDGAPIVGSDMMVESGNGRTMAIKLAYNLGTAKEYKKYLEDHAAEFGLTKEQVKDMKQPILVRERQGKLSLEKRKQFTRKANESDLAQMSTAEQAKVDAEKLGTITDFVSNETGDINTAANKPFILRFQKEVIPESERGNFLDDKGKLSIQGINRIKAAIFHAAYGSSELIELATTSTDNNIRNITNGLMQAAPEIAKMKEQIRDGHLYDLDISDIAVKAIQSYLKNKKEGISVDDWLKQRGLFGNNVDPATKKLVKFFDETKRSGKKINEFFRNYVDYVKKQGDPKQKGIWSNQEHAAILDLIKSAREKVYAEEKQRLRNRKSQQNIFQESRPEQGSSGGNQEIQGEKEKEKEKIITSAKLKEKARAKKETKYSKRQLPPEQQADVRSELTKAFGKEGLANLEKAGLKIVKAGEDATIEGYVKNGIPYLVQGNIAKGEAAAKALHEIGVHVRRLGFTEQKSFQRLLKDLRKRKDQSRIIQEAYDQVHPDTLPEHVDEEALARLVERAEIGNKKGMLFEVRRLFSQLKRFLVDKMGISTKILSEKDLQNLAVSVLRHETKGRMLEQINEFAQPIQYSLKKTDRTHTITGPDGTEYLVNKERYEKFNKIDSIAGRTKYLENMLKKGVAEVKQVSEPTPEDMKYAAEMLKRNIKKVSSSKKIIPPEIKPFLTDFKVTKEKVKESALGKFASSVHEDVLKIFSPATLANRISKNIDPIVAHMVAKETALRENYWRMTKERRKWWDTIPEPIRLQFMYSMEEGDFSGLKRIANGDFRLYQTLRAIAKDNRKTLDAIIAEEKKNGIPINYIKNYWPHIWEDKEKAEIAFGQYANNMGRDRFSKLRTIDLLRIGVEELGLKLKTTNPEEMIQMRLDAGYRAITRQQTIKELESRGIAKKLVIGTIKKPGEVVAIGSNGKQYLLTEKRAKKFAEMSKEKRVAYLDGLIKAGKIKEYVSKGNTDIPGMVEFNAPDGKRYLIPKEVEPLLVSAGMVIGKGKTLWMSDDTVGKVYRASMAAKNLFVPIKLGLSAFHAVHVATIDTAARRANIYLDIINKNLGWEEGIKEIGRVSAGLHQAEAMKKGKAIIDAYGKDPSKRTEWEKQALQTIAEAGQIPVMSEEYRIKAEEALNKALAEHNIPGIVGNAIRRLIEVSGKPIFEIYVPRLKVATLLDRAERLLSERPELANDIDARRVELRKIGKEIDNEYGEMFYKTLFWNRMVKDIGIGSLLSMGWQVGFVREYSGGAADTARFVRDLIKKEGKPEITRKMLFTLDYTIQSMIIGGIITTISQMLMGKKLEDALPKELLDYFYPRSGNTNLDGSPTRFNTPFYTREFFAAWRHYQKSGLIGGVGVTLANKANPLFAPIIHVFQNKDYFGTDIADPHADFITKTAQRIEYLLGELLPISVSSMKRSMQNMSFAKALISSELGFTMAPRYVTQDWIQKMIFDEYSDQASRGRSRLEAKHASLKRKLRLEIMKTGTLEPEHLREAIAAGAFGLGPPKQIKTNIKRFLRTAKQNSDVRVFSYLNTNRQLYLLEKMKERGDTKAFKKYFRHAKRSTKFIMLKEKLKEKRRRSLSNG